MVWDGVQVIKKFRVDVWVVFVSFSDWVLCDVEKLIAKVVCISYAMVVIAGVPDLSC